MGYQEDVMSGMKSISLRMERAVMTGKSEPMSLPWEPAAGGPCPYCWGQGYDDGGPGSWSCRECGRTGRLAKNFTTDAEYVVNRTDVGDDYYRRAAHLTKEE